MFMVVVVVDVVPVSAASLLMRVLVVVAFATAIFPLITLVFFHA